ncbi:ligase-associated DNA damage response exonuclease [Olivibacter sp. SDN3]|uniref:ligase-associated DNA damage response exonuclease n=1 Tax=Olivibacter sp. SDN3 TaxID=2764720 RepID=UPI001651A473|nr:ligase-associated DNA damage response exonuclease [Olivibacter sp. SDN3]QNL50844.1 ligase-associated DNA damage response exonuclease [Olivibacter sp. SDN3]
MLTFNKKGIYCKQAKVYIDPWVPVNKAIITHAHADHARSGHQHYLCHKDTEALLRLRLGKDIKTEALQYNEPIHINGVRISLHPAGHIIGSAQVRLEYKGEIWVVSGDYKLQNDNLSTPFEPLRCHHFITESTFGLPIYHFPDPALIKTQTLDWIANNQKQKINSLLVGYSLGKAQRIIQQLQEVDMPIFAHGAITTIQNQLIHLGKPLVPVTYASVENIQSIGSPYLVIMPPSAVGTPWLKKFMPYETAFYSGWMQLRGARRRRNVNRGFILSDHADWNQLNNAIKISQAENIYVTHGYKSIYAKWLREEYQLNAVEVDTLYDDQLLNEEANGDTLQ